MNRVMRRHRYVEGAGWVVSQDTFKARMQPKFNDSLRRTRDPEDSDCFLNTIAFRENTKPINTYATNSFTFATSGEAVAAAMTGDSVIIGDRIVEDGTGYMLMIRGVSPYRDKYLKHDEITCSEASQFDQKWIEPVKILFDKDLGEPEVGMFYDPIRRQYIKVQVDEDLICNEAFGVIDPYDRTTETIVRMDPGKEYDDRMILSIDASFGATQNTIFYLRGKYWKVEYMRDGLTRVQKFGLTVWKQRGASGDDPRELASRNVIT